MLPMPVFPDVADAEVTALRVIEINHNVGGCYDIFYKAIEVDQHANLLIT